MVVVLLYMQFIQNKQLASLSDWLQHLSSNVYRHPVFAILKPQQARVITDKKPRSLVRFLNYLLLVTLMCLTLSQPYQVGEKLPEPPAYRDIVFLVDTSVSMVLRDYLVDGKRTQRMTVLKDVLTHFVDQLQGNRIQIIPFAEQAYTLVPLTTDYELLKFQLQRLKPASLTGRNSDLSRALLYALAPYQETQSVQDKKPVFVMLSDADRPVRDIDPKVAAAYVAKYGISLHTVAIGAASYEAEDQERTSLVYHPASFYLLEQVAKLGNGQFFWANDITSLQQALISINQAGKHKITSEPEYIHKSLYFWPLMLMLIWLTLIYLLELARGLRWTS
jgi:Ca-activated chloride channel family protein